MKYKSKDSLHDLVHYEKWGLDASCIEAFFLSSNLYKGKKHYVFVTKYRNAKPRKAVSFMENKKDIHITYICSEDFKKVFSDVKTTKIVRFEHSLFNAVYLNEELRGIQNNAFENVRPETIGRIGSGLIAESNCASECLDTEHIIYTLTREVLFVTRGLKYNRYTSEELFEEQVYSMLQGVLTPSSINLRRLIHEAQSITYSTIPTSLTGTY